MATALALALVAPLTATVLQAQSPASGGTSVVVTLPIGEADHAAAGTADA